MPLTSSSDNSFTQINGFSEIIASLNFARYLGETGAAEEDIDPAQSWRWECLRPKNSTTIALAVDVYCVEYEPLSGSLTIFGEEFQLDAMLVAAHAWVTINAPNSGVVFGEGDKYISVRFRSGVEEPGANGLLSTESFTLMLGDLKNLVSSGEFWHQAGTLVDIYNRKIATASAAFTEQLKGFQTNRGKKNKKKEGKIRSTRRMSIKVVEG